MTATGRCLCGAVRVRVAAEPITVRACWCRDCQYLNSGGPSHNAFFRSEDVEAEGQLRWFDKAADSGATLSRGFCPTCGAHLLVQSHARRHLMGVRIGAFDDREPLAPRSIIWTSSAPGWACFDPALPQEPRQPAPVA